jgi:hypothetical protein
VIILYFLRLGAHVVLRFALAARGHDGVRRRPYLVPTRDPADPNRSGGEREGSAGHRDRNCRSNRTPLRAPYLMVEMNVHWTFDTVRERAV